MESTADDHLTVDGDANNVVVGSDPEHAAGTRTHVAVQKKDEWSSAWAHVLAAPWAQAEEQEPVMEAAGDNDDGQSILARFKARFGHSPTPSQQEIDEDNWAVIENNWPDVDDGK